MLFIVHPNYEQDRLDTVVNAVKKEISDKGGKVLKVDDWGKRKLAYLINKQRYGSYILMYFEVDPEIIQELYAWMEIQSQVLHQMIIRLEEKPELSEGSENPDSRRASYSKDKERKSEEKVEKPETDDKNLTEEPVKEKDEEIGE